MPAPTNLSALTATDVGTLPANISQNVHDAGTTYTVWYKYTAQAPEQVIGVFGFGALVGYRPTVVIWTGDPSAPDPWLSIAAQNVPVQLPVVAGQTYFFEFRVVGNPSPAVLTLSVLTAPQLLGHTGSIFINDDAPGFPAAILSSTTGEVRNFVYPFPAGEAGDILPSGRSLIADEFVDFDFKLYDPLLALITAVAFTGTGAARVRTQNTAGRFYAAYAGSGFTAAVVQTVSAAGVLGTLWTLPQSGLTALAANNAETILYNAGQGGSVAAPIKRWDLIGSTMLADLVAGVADHVIGDLLVLGDDTIVASYFKSSVTRVLFVRRYNAAGATLNTYTINGSTITSTLPRLAYAIDDPLSFWVWFHPSIPGGFSQFQNVRVSDGVILTDVTSTEYEGGAYQPAETATPTARFGNSFSCPFVILRGDVPVPIVEVGCPVDFPVDPAPAGLACPAPGLI